MTLLSVLLILGLVSGTTMQATQAAMMAGLPGMAVAAVDHSGMPDCQGCVPGQGTDKGMKTTGWHNGVCIVLPGVLPSALDGPTFEPDAFVSAAPTVADGLSPPPDPRPPRPTSLA
jgi:hypothetical protein